jgi:hypothetical protein
MGRCTKVVSDSIYVVHASEEIDSDTGHSTYYTSRVFGAFNTYAEADKMISDLRDNSNVRNAQFTLVTVGEYPKWLLNLMEARRER